MSAKSKRYLIEQAFPKFAERAGATYTMNTVGKDLVITVRFEDDPDPVDSYLAERFGAA